MAHPAAVLLDLDGTLYTDRGPVTGAAEALERLRRFGVPVRFITNTTSRPRGAVLERLRSFGIPASDDELFVPSSAALAHFREAEVRTVAPFVPAVTLGDYAGVEFTGGSSGRKAEGRPDAVLIGDLDDAWTGALLNEAFRYLMDGAGFVALQRGRYWLRRDGVALDAGAYVAALEYASGREARMCGKPEVGFYRAAIESLGLDPDRLPRAPHTPVMVGDDLWNDVRGAQDAGLAGWLVRTGKFRPEALETAGITPDRVLDSIADI